METLICLLMSSGEACAADQCSEASYTLDEDPNLDTLTIAACFTCAGELDRAFLVGWCSLRGVSLLSEERGVVAGKMAFLFPFEEWQDIRVVGRGWRKLLS